MRKDEHRDRALARLERDDLRDRVRQRARNAAEMQSLRARARGDEHIYRLNGGAREPTRPLDDAEVHVGMRVLARGTLGVVESISCSLATHQKHYVVAHDPRMRLTYRLDELSAAPL